MSQEPGEATSTDKWLETERSVSPTPDNVSVKSDWSKGEPPSFSQGQPGRLEPERSVSPAPSNVSMKSDWSKGEPPSFSKGQPGRLEHTRSVSPAPDNVSVKSDWSKGEPPSFSKGEPGWLETERSVSPAPDNVSVKSDWSKGEPPSFSKGEPRWLETERSVSPAPSNISVKSDWSKGEPPSFRKGQPGRLETERSVSPAPDNVSMKSDWSKGEPPSFSKGQPGRLEHTRPVSPAPDNVSVKSDWSKGEPPSFSQGEPGWLETERSVSPAPDNVSVKSDWSKGEPPSFSKGEPRWLETERSVSPAPDNVSVKSDWSKGEPPSFRKGQPGWLETERSVSPAPDNVSVKSDWSKGEPPSFSKEQPGRLEHTRSVSPAPDNVSIKSDWSKGEPPSFSKGQPGRLETERPVSPAPDNVSVKSDWSKGEPPSFSKGQPGWLEQQRSVSPAPSNVSVKSDWSKGEPPSFSKGEPGLLEPERPVPPAPGNVSVKSDWSKGEPPSFSKGQPVWPENTRPVSPAADNVSVKSDRSKDKPHSFSKEQPGGMKTGLDGQKHSKGKDVKHKLTADLKKRILSQHEDKLKSHETDTEIYEIPSVPSENAKPQTFDALFPNSEEKKVRTVLMRGVAGVGKTFQKSLFLEDWAKDKSNKKIDLIVSFNFHELNSRDEVQSVNDLIHHSFNDDKDSSYKYDECKVVFVLDGLEECELPLDFAKNEDLTDMEEPASMDVLLTNLIKGKLLPSASLWIIARPSGVDKIPPEYIHKETGCRETSKRWQKLASALRKRFLGEATQDEDINHPNKENTEHIIREEGSGEVNDEKKNGHTAVKSLARVNAVSDIFKDTKGQKIRTVLTTGEAGIGKSFHVQQFIKEWAKNEKSLFTWFIDGAKAMIYGKADEVIFHLNFSKLNLIKEKKVSLMGLLNHFLEETKPFVISNFEQFNVLFVLDGLDDQPPLDVDNNDTLTDVREPASVDVLLTSLIRGTLLPSARLWITSRKLSDARVDRTTEIRCKPDIASHQTLKSQLKEQFTHVHEGIDMQKASALLNEIYTDLYIIEGERGEVNDRHEIRQVQDAKFKPMGQETSIKYCDIFKPASENIPIRTVLTIGMAGIGKTFATKKYMLDWAEGSDNRDIYYMFPLSFRELNLRKEKEHSLEDLIHQFCPGMKTSEITDYDKYRILIVLDGLDECRLDLDFNESDKWTEVRERTSVNVLLRNLIQGNLLSKAQIWITSRPAASNHIPADKVDRVTEVRGFNDEQKEEYFRKRFGDTDLAEKILSHVKKSISLYIMCHIPVFCWITAKVLENFVNRKEKGRMPETLTDMYIHFLVLQCRQANVKYGADETGENSETDSCWNTRNKETVMSLGKLAFEGLVEGNLLFTEETLTECGVDITKTAVFSGLFTQIKREGSGLYPHKLFCFVHLSIQEFLAAFYVFHTFNNTGANLLAMPAPTVGELPAPTVGELPAPTVGELPTPTVGELPAPTVGELPTPTVGELPAPTVGDLPADFYKTAIDKALKSKNGDWDLFLRFLLGLSLETNQEELQELLKKTEDNNETINKETIVYIKEKIREENSDADRNCNLFYCLNELKDHSLVEEVKDYLKSETLSFESFSTSMWSALTFVLLTSYEKLGVFDLKKYLKSEKVLLGMLPVVKVSKTALLSWCELSEDSCSGLSSSVLCSVSSNLTELDLSHNDLLDAGVQMLAEGLQSLHCKLEILKLSGCQVTEKGCSFLASALTSKTASSLKQLDLSFNHPGPEGETMLSAIAADPNTNLKTLCLDHCGAHRLKPGLKKYGADLRLDENTASKRLALSDGNRKVKTVEKVEEKVPRPENIDRFKRSQVFCEKGLKGLCYWEVELKGKVGIAVAYRAVGRRWDRSGGLGCNKNSWSLLCSRTGYTAIHENTYIYIDIELDDGKTSEVKTKDGKTSEVKLNDGKTSEVKTNNGKTSEVKPNDGKTSEVKPKDGKTSEVKPKDGKTSEVKPNDGKTSKVKPKDGKTSEVKPKDGKTSEVKPKDGKTSEVKTKDGKTSEVKPKDGKTSEVKTNNGKTSEVKPNDGKTSEVKPKGRKTSEVKPNNGKTSEVKPKDGKTSEVKPKGRKTSEVKPNYGKTSEVKPKDGKTSEVKPKGRKTSEVKTKDGKTSEVKPKDGKTSEVKTNDGKTSEVKPNDGKTSEVKPNNGKTSEVKPKDGKTSEVKPKGRKTSEVKPNNGKTSEVKPKDGKTSEVKPKGRKTSEVKPNNGKTSQDLKLNDGKTLKDFKPNKRVPLCKKIAVFLDWEAGTLTYYGVISEKLIHIHTFHAKFTEPLFPCFWFQKGSVTLCEID
ncbi:uncharacterized protein LOC119489909 isoform X35 [Sebastes umbrosus]|uniref:uncharacterized protein LOC119489909 isoform X35 n=1 Tax=Sebastes umbrosus TaxID=72105 RepID=UPI0018A01AFF|nr:uncharacterized protein LOC119489909 isoform X35 [Sebastes umbrosus]